MPDRASAAPIRPDLAPGFDEPAKRSGCARSELVEEAAGYHDVRHAQIKGVRAALRDLEAGESGLPHEELGARHGG